MNRLRQPPPVLFSGDPDRLELLITLLNNLSEAHLRIAKGATAGFAAAEHASMALRCSSAAALLFDWRGPLKGPSSLVHMAKAWRRAESACALLKGSNSPYAAAFCSSEASREAGEAAKGSGHLPRSPVLSDLALALGSSTGLPKGAGIREDKDLALGAAGSLKEEGNTLLRSGSLSDAAARYRDAIALLAPGAAGLALSDLAAAELKDSRPAEAVVAAAAATLLAPSLLAAYETAGRGLLQLGGVLEAAAVASASLRVAGGSGSSGGQSLRALKAETEKGIPQCSPPTGKVIRGDDPDPFGERTQSQHETVAKLNKMVERAPPAARAMLLDDRVPPFHEEMRRAGFPKGCDAQACFHHLWSGYEHARSKGHEMALDTEVEPDAASIFKRLGPAAMNPAAVDWYANSPIGSIRWGSRGTYNYFTCHGFSNAPSRTEILSPGTTHVAVGFVDLGILRSCHPAPGEEDSGPLRFIGYEASPYAVAKTLVVAEMLGAGFRRDTRASVEEVLQVWYSAAWSAATLGAFHRALASLLAPPTSAPAIDPRVRFILRHWHQQGTVPLAEARKGWLALMRRTATGPVNFKDKADRLALCRYQVTGQLLDAEWGSTAMFRIPNEAGVLSYDESVFSCIWPSDLWDARRRPGVKDVVEAATLLLREGITRLQEWVGQGKVEIELHLQPLLPEDKATHAAIRALRPYSMSWSNVCDYVSPKDFHKMARACSVDAGHRSTIHFLYSMNWIQEVKGAILMDYAGPGKLHWLNMGRRMIDLSYDLYGLDSLHLNPPNDHPYNVAQMALCYRHSDDWTKAFLDAAPGPKPSLGNAERSMYCVLGHNNSNLHLTLTYSPDLVWDPRSRPGPLESSKAGSSAGDATDKETADALRHLLSLGGPDVWPRGVGRWVAEDEDGVD